MPIQRTVERKFFLSLSMPKKQFPYNQKIIPSLSMPIQRMVERKIFSFTFYAEKTAR